MRATLLRILALCVLLAPWCAAQATPPAPAAPPTQAATPPLPPVVAPDFTLVALPDPQMYSEFFPEIFKAQTEWIAKHAADQNIKLVAILGDLVNDGDSAEQFNHADDAVTLLDRAHIPYLVVIGNHDYLHTQPATRQAPLFEQHFGPQRYAAYDYFGQSTWPAHSARNFYATLSINGEPYLFLVLEYFPPKEAVAWAKTVLDAHPDHKVVMLTHAFTGSDGFRAGRCDFNGPSAEGVEVALTAEDMWDQLVSRYASFFLVLNGHVNGAARRADPGVHGNLVNQILADYQDNVQGGGGFLRILTFKPALRQIVVRTYSPWYDEYKSDDANSFTVPLDASALDLASSGIRGHIRDAECTDLVGASVTWSNGKTSATVLTGVEGYFASPNLAPGTYTVRANAPGYAPARLTVEVRPGYSSPARPFLSPATSEFTLAAAAASQSVSPGAPASYNVAIARTGAFPGAVRFSVAGLPPGASASFTPALPTRLRRAALLVKTAPGTPPGSYPLLVTGESGDMQRTLALTLVIAP